MPYFFNRAFILRIIVAVELAQQRAAVIVLNAALKEHFAITAAKCALEFCFQPGKALGPFAHSCQFLLQHELHFCAGMRLLPQGK